MYIYIYIYIYIYVGRRLILKLHLSVARRPPEVTKLGGQPQPQPAGATATRSGASLLVRRSLPWPPRLCVVSSWLAPLGLPSLSKSGVLLRQNHGLRKKDQFDVDGMAVFYVCFA